MGGNFEDGDEPVSQRLTNEDFRKLLMTPRASHTPSLSQIPKDNTISSSNNLKESTDGALAQNDGEDRGELRRKKKSYYAALKKQEDSKLAELAEKYRDRARERRDNSNPDYVSEEIVGASSAYRAVAPDLKSGLDAKERRRQIIQESKFLGGDMEHTHLVKGLDYALLQKVRSEIRTKENEDIKVEEPVEEVSNNTKENDDLSFKTQMGKDVYELIKARNSKKIIRNEMFAPGRMAYSVDLEEDSGIGDSDIPTTLVRSRAELPSTSSGQPTLTTNDIVINKLAQVLSYLRHGSRHSKAKKMKDKTKKIESKDDSIYGDIGDYVPTQSDKRKDKKDSNKSYFDEPLEKEKEVLGPKIKATASLLSKLAAEPEGYAECYPGLREMDDAIEDSDDETDYTKMDAGNKKGPIGRWDFDTQEEYSAYMNQREALPKAAFQYGVKTADGRKTRKTNKDKNDKAEFNREWQKIQNIIQKRKGPKDKEEPEFKVPKY